jgi:hypothetical protein
VVTLLLYAVVALVAVGCLYGLALLFLSAREQIAPAAADRPPWHLGEDVLGPDDVVGVRLPVTLRGYRFAETDLLLDRLTEEIRQRDEEIARLRAGGEPTLAPGAVPAAARAYASPTYSTPAYSAPSYAQPSYGQPSYGEPSGTDGLPSYPAPAYPPPPAGPGDPTANGR